MHGVACQDLHDRYQLDMHFLCENMRKQSNTKWEKVKCVKYVETILKYFYHSVKSVSLCRKSVFGKSSAELPKTRERCDKFAGRIASRAQNPNFGHWKTVKLWIEWIIWIIWNYKRNFRTESYSYALLERFIGYTAVPSGNLAMGKRKQPISGWFSMVFRYPLFPSISHVCHIWLWWGACEQMASEANDSSRVARCIWSNRSSA